MKTIEEFLSDIASKNIRIQLSGDKLKLKCKKEDLTPELRNEIATKKEEIIFFLRQNKRHDENKIVPVERKKYHPASFEQNRLWFLDKFHKGMVAYNNAVAWRIQGALKIDVLQKSLQSILERHEALRTRFDVVDGKTVQYIEEHQELCFRKIDLSSMPEAEAKMEGKHLIDQEFRTPFDLKEGPLLRVLLVKIREEDFLLEINPHHIISDGWSWEIIFKEIKQFYESYSMGKTVSLQPLEIQFADFAEWQNRNVTDEALAYKLKYWKTKLKDAPEKTKLPFDYQRPKLQTFNGKRIFMDIPKDLAKSIKQIGAENGTSLFMTLLGYIHLLFYTYSGSTNINIGTAVANRSYEQLENIVGFFVNTLVINNVLDVNKNFVDFLQTVRETCLDAYANEVPFDKVVEELDFERDTSCPPVVQTMFVLQDVREGDLQIDNLEIESVEIDRGTIRVDLEIYFWEDKDKITGYFEYNTDLFKESTILRMVENFKHILAYVTEHKTVPIKEMNLLAPKEYSKVVTEFNDTKCEFSDEATMTWLVEESVKKYPAHIAITNGSESITYQQANDFANQIANLLIEKGIQMGDFVAVCMERSICMVESLLAVLKAGAAYVPFETDIPKERMCKILDNNKLAFLITDQEHATFFKDLANGIENIKYMLVVNGTYEPRVSSIEVLDIRTIQGQSKENPNQNIQPDHPAYVIYTSGSTGTPKGVLVNHQSAVNLIEWVNKTYQIQPGDKELFVTSPGFDLSVYDMFGIMAAGATIRLVENTDLKEPKNLLRIIEEEEITFWDSAPQKLQQLVPFMKGKLKKPSALKHVFLSGDWIPLTLPGQVKDYFQTPQVVSLGGATEATIWSNYYDIQELDPNWVSIPYGKPIQNAKYYILNDQLKPCPIGVAGDLYIGDLCLAKGYINDTALTDSKFIPSPFIPGEKIYKTGDLARWYDDGNMEFLGRSDFQVKIRGYRIELGEIESTILKHDDVNASIVVDIEENGSKLLCAYYVSQQPIETEQLESFLRKTLPDYMVPSYFVYMDKLPVTDNGKVDRKALPKPEHNTEYAYQAPETQIQIQLAGIWSETLGQEKIGIHDNFFMLGGQSLLAAEVTEKISEAFNVDIPLSELFHSSTIFQLEQYIKQHQSSVDVRKECISKAEKKPYYDLTDQEEDILRLRNFDKITVYNEVRGYEIEGAFDYDKFENALMTLIERHDGLRTRYEQIEGRYVRIVESMENITFSIQKIIESDQEKIQDFINHFPKVFRIEQAPLLDVAIIKVSEEKHIFLYNMDHLIYDAVSIKIFTKELCSLYNGNKLEPPKIQYTDYSEWRKNLVKSEKYEEAKRYWVNEFDSSYKSAQLASCLDESIPESEGGIYSVVFEEETVAKIKDVCRQYGVTPYMFMQANLKILLYKYSGIQDVTVATAMVGRENNELSGVMGIFYQLIAIRNCLSEEQTFSELIQDVKKKSLCSLEQAIYPMSQIRKNLNGRSPYGALLLWEDAGEKLQLNDLICKDIPIAYEDVQGRTMFLMEEHLNSIKFSLYYSLRYYRAEMVQKLLEDYKFIVESTVAQREIKLKEIICRNEH